MNYKQYIYNPDGEFEGDNKKLTVLGGGEEGRHASQQLKMGFFAFSPYW